VRRQHVPPSPAAGGPSSPAPGASTPQSHRCRCGRASLCRHGHRGRVRACRVVRARVRHAFDAFASPAADAPSRARRLWRADARSSGEGAARPRLCAGEAGESWSVGRGHRGCTRRCLSRAGVLGSPTRPAVRGVGGGFRSKVASEAPADRVDAAIGSLPHRVRLAKQDSSVTRNTHLARETNAHHVLSGQGSTLGRQKSWQPGDRTTCVRCNRTIFNHVATLGA
jgi:hypothetical protein